jgi:predicted nucleic acid-binding protein
MYLIDTNIHTAYLLQEDFEKDDLTKKYLELYKEITLADRIVPDFILGEFETFIVQVAPSRFQLNPEDKRKLKQLALDYIRTLTDECTVIVPEVKTVQRARDIFFENAHTHYMSFIDCLVLATADLGGYHLMTKDTRLTARAKELGVTCYEPYKEVAEK